MAALNMRRAWALAFMIASCSSVAACGGGAPRGETPGASDFNKAAASKVLADAAAAAKACKQPGGPTGATRVFVTWAQSGVTTTVRVQDPPFEGTAVGDCIASVFAKARVPPYEGVNKVGVTKTVTIE